jgi:hypothetical protein
MQWLELQGMLLPMLVVAGAFSVTAGMVTWLQDRKRLGESPS